MPKDFERMTPEQIEAAEQVSIVDYCMANGIAVKPDSGEDWRMVEPDSVVITGHKWNRTSQKPCPYTDFTGGSATQFVQAFEGLSYREAVFKLLSFINSPLLPEEYKPSIKGKFWKYTKKGSQKQQDRPQYGAPPPLPPEILDQLKAQTGGAVQEPEQQAKPTAKPKKPFKLPIKHEHNKNVFAYLTKSRCIDPEIVNHFIKHGLLYQSNAKPKNSDKEYANCVFVGYAPDGVARYACLKGTNSYADKAFRGDVAGSKKMFSFSYTPQQDSFILRLEESPIEILSHMTLDKMAGEDWRNKHYQSLGGLTYEPVYAYLKEHPEIEVLEVCTNNDEAGRNMVDRYKTRFGDKVQIVHNPPDISYIDDEGQQRGDYNDLLKKKLQSTGQPMSGSGP